MSITVFKCLFLCPEITVRCGATQVFSHPKTNFSLIMRTQRHIQISINWITPCADYIYRNAYTKYMLLCMQTLRQRQPYYVDVKHIDLHNILPCCVHQAIVALQTCNQSLILTIFPEVTLIKRCYMLFAKKWFSLEGRPGCPRYRGLQRMCQTFSHLNGGVGEQFGCMILPCISIWSSN